MAAVNYDLAIEQGSSYEVTFLYTDQNNQPIDVKNFCILLQWKTDTDIIHTFTNKYTGTDYSLVSDTNGTIVFKIPAKTTNLYTFDTAFYDLDLQEPAEEYPGSGFKNYRLSTGTVNIIKRNVPASLVSCADPSAGDIMQNSCDIECGKLDIYSVIYNGSSINVPDLGISSGTITVNDSRKIDNIEIAIDGLRHNSPQDLVFLVAPPSGDKILLSANSKINNYKPGFSCMFSNRASSSAYISNINSGGLCRIYDKTSTTKYNNEILLSSFNHLYNSSPSGNWSLIINDIDPAVSGSIDAWKLIITYSE